MSAVRGRGERPADGHERGQGEAVSKLDALLDRLEPLVLDPEADFAASRAELAELRRYKAAWERLCELDHEAHGWGRGWLPKRVSDELNAIVRAGVGEPAGKGR